MDELTGEAPLPSGLETRRTPSVFAEEVAISAWCSSSGCFFR